MKRVLLEVVFDDFVDGEVRFDFGDFDFYVFVDFCVGNDDDVVVFDVGDIVVLFVDVFDFDVVEFVGFDGWLWFVCGCWFGVWFGFGGFV